MPIVEDGSAVSGGGEVRASSKALVTTIPGFNSAGVVFGGGPENGPAMFFENDPGEASGARTVRSPEVDSDYRLRMAQDHILDRETFNYVAQNTGKYSHAFTTLTATASAAGLLTNSGSIITLNTGMTFGTHAEFPCGIGATVIYAETSVSFSAAAAPTNAVVDIGMFRRGASTAFAPADGAYFRIQSSGIFGVINRGGTETQVGPFNLALVPNQNYLMTITVSEKRCRFWIDDVMMGVVENLGTGQPFTSASLPWSVRHAIVGGAASGNFQATISDYTISMGGPLVAQTMAQISNRSLGSYQGLSGGVMGSLANYANNVNPTAAVATNTTAALGVGLGGQFWETATLGVNIDGIIMAYQVPLGALAVQGRRLVITGISLTSYIQTVLVGGPCNIQYSLAFGHTSVSMANPESASFATGTTKAPRRIALPQFTQVVTAAQAVSTMVAQPGGASIVFANPIYVNSGELVVIAAKKVGTAITAGVLAHMIAFDYGWE